MGKKGKKKNKKDKKEKQERKQKAQESKSNRSQKRVAEEDVDAILSGIQALDMKANTAVAVTATSNPSPRCNGTLVAHPTENRVYLYGGEYFNGKTTQTFADLFVCNLANMEFKMITAPNRPLPRNSHQAVALARQGGQMWVYGGEFTSPKGEFHHYKDLWCLELKTNTWNEVRARGAPSPRSGHRMITHDNKLIVFGGFYDNGSAIMNHDDLHVFDLSTMTWQEIKRPNKSTLWPKARAGHQFMAHTQTNTALLYGGIRMEAKNAETKTHYFGDAWKLDLEHFTWSKLRVRGQGPNPRAGMTMAIHRERAVFFGGVSDQESELDYDSTCHNDVFSLSLSSGSWNTVTPRDGQAPPPRRNAQMVVKGNQLLVFGGVLDQKKKEITLNDWHSLDLKKQDSWQARVEMDLGEQEWLGSDLEADEDEDEKSEPEEPEPEPEEDEGAEEVEVDIPMSNENLREFFTRSKEHWMKVAAEEAPEGSTSKQLRKLAFDKAAYRFEEYE